jgi:V8-like Glu-specific endopeptidase
MSQMQFPIPTNYLLMSFKLSLRIGLSIFTPLLLTISGAGYLPGDPANAVIFNRSGNKIPDREVNSDRVNWQMLSTAKGRKYNGVGIVDADRGEGICTGFSISMGANLNAPAYVLTNGHCQGVFNKSPKQQGVLVNRSTETRFIINYFHDFKPARLSIPVKRMVYGTMKNNDLAILELTITQRELSKLGITPLQIAPTPPTLGEPIIVVGIPLQGVKNGRNFLHSTTCKIGKIANVKEDIYNWQRSIRNRCSIVGGMSGSPMISLKTNRVIGIINTGVDDNAAKQRQCSLNRPCEIVNNKLVQTFPHENYGQLVDRIPTCFDRHGVFDLSQSTCQLERP